MSETTKIEWCDHTWNPWEGCSKVSEGCLNCYAETRANRFQTVSWGPQGTRRVAAESYWRQPLKWDREAKECGERRKVFCASLADVFEDWQGPMVGSGRVILGKDYRASTNPERRLTMGDVRRRLWEIIVATPHLDWLLLTKRPENINRMLGPRGINFYAVEGPVPCPQPNVWLGVSVENQKAADERIPLLLQTPAAVRFLSCEPLLEHVHLPTAPAGMATGGTYIGYPHSVHGTGGVGISWVIIGGESGPKARPCDLSWIESIIEQCSTAKVACFVKQLGSCPVATPVEGYTTGLPKLRDRKGGDMNEFPEYLRVRQWPVIEGQP